MCTQHNRIVQWFGPAIQGTKLQEDFDLKARILGYLTGLQHRTERVMLPRSMIV